MLSHTGSPGVLQENHGELLSPQPVTSNTLSLCWLCCNSMKKQGNKLALLSILSGWGSRGRLGGSRISVKSAVVGS